MTLLEGLRRAPSNPSLAPGLLVTVRDATRRPSGRLRASKVYVRWMSAVDAGVRALLNYVATGTVEDADDEILDALLVEMYPKALPSSELPRFMHPPKKENLIGRYTMFWLRDLAEVDAAELSSLLDAFALRPELRESEDGRRTRDYSEAIGVVLARALDEVADQIPDERLRTRETGRSSRAHSSTPTISASKTRKSSLSDSCLAVK